MPGIEKTPAWKTGAYEDDRHWIAGFAGIVLLTAFSLIPWSGEICECSFS
jgi:hypothetical protein